MMRPILYSNLFFLAFTIISGCQPPVPKVEILPPTVTTVTPEVKNVSIYLTENATLEAAEQATARSRVQGIVGPMLPKLDQDVKKNDLLFNIAPEEYIAKLNAASATLESAKATVKEADAQLLVSEQNIVASIAEMNAAEAEFIRMSKLHVSKAVSDSEFDKAKAENDIAIAAVSAAKAKKETSKASILVALAQVSKASADLEQAQLNLDWTNITAPIDGRVGKPMIKSGNLVEIGDELVEIINSEPIWANFNVRESFILERNRSGKLGKKIEIEVELQRSGDKDFPFKGVVDFFDPKVDPNTGTLALRAVFQNPRNSPLGILLPGFFVRVRVEIDQLDNALLIPEKAINRDQTGNFVFVVDQERKAQRITVETGTTQDGLIVVTSGLSATDKVIVEGLQRVRPGIEVRESKTETKSVKKTN
ncbi:MAG: efflux RND transporter periplasmic adaptor subunit [Pirellulales bacterium]|jgi:RND family efflux transporter MFP subunit